MTNKVGQPVRPQVRRTVTPQPRGIEMSKTKDKAAPESEAGQEVEEPPTDREYAIASLRKIVEAGIGQNNAEGWTAAISAASTILNCDRGDSMSGYSGK